MDIRVKKYRLQIPALLLLFFLFNSALFGLLPGDDLRIESDPKVVKFLQEFLVHYSLPKDERILAVITTNYNFARTSIDIRLESFTNNGFTIRVKSYELSNFSIPPLTVASIRNNRTNTFQTPEYPVRAVPLGISNIQQAPIEDIYAFHDWLWLMIVLTVIALAAGIYFTLRLLKAQKQTKAKDSSAGVIDPYEEALGAINSLRTKDLTKENYRDIFQTVWETNRRFIERTYKINAQEMATSEIVEYFKHETKNKPEWKELLDIIVHVFRICDRVKYAKHIPDRSQKDTVITESVSFIHNTQRLLAPKIDETTSGGGSV